MTSTSRERLRTPLVTAVAILLLGAAATAQRTHVAIDAGGGSPTIDPTRIPKYVIPLVIPPVMDHAGTADEYEIAVREFRQQILPGGIWNTINGRNDPFGPTTVWSYGPADDPVPVVAPDPSSGFNYPAYTIETLSSSPVDVRWINDLVEPDGTFRRHLLAVDQTVHWANPPGGDAGKDKVGTDVNPYEGPVPLVTHVHGAHVGPESDGYPEAWWLPAATDIPDGYATYGTLFDDVSGTNAGDLGYADFRYPNDQPATTLWYHDHALGMTRLNVYAGPAGFWLIRGGAYDAGLDTSTGGAATLPGPAPVAGDGVLELNLPGDPVRSSIREIPIVVQDRSFEKNGELWYPDDRAYFEGVEPSELRVTTAPDTDIKPIWVPEAFFDVMVVNGVSWPALQVAPAQYRFRLLNGCNSRFLNLSLWVVASPDPSLVGMELPFFQIGAEQGFLTTPVMVQTGYATALQANGSIPPLAPAPDPDQALLLALAERADTLVDFRGLPDGTVVRMQNSAPDAPFSGFSGGPFAGDEDVADPATTGQVMQFIVRGALDGMSPTDPAGATPATDPWDLVLASEEPLRSPDNAGSPRLVSLNELESESVCVLADPATEEYVVPIQQVPCDTPSPTPDGYEVVPFGPSEARLGTVQFGEGGDELGVPLKWTSTGVGVKRTVTVPSGDVDVWVTENPDVGAVEEWDVYNFTGDAHPIHLHLVRFEVVSRTVFDPDDSPPGADVVQPWERGFKDTVIAYPGQVTRVKAHFDREGLYVWHCHIVEHEDNEMMRPYYVGGDDDAPRP